MKSTRLFLTALIVLIGYSLVFPQKIRMLIGAKHQGQYAGFFLAQTKGMYKNAGLDVQFVFSEQMRSADMLLTNKTDFAMLMLPTAIQLQAKGSNLMHLMQLHQKSSVLIVAKKKAGIKSVNDLQDKKTGVWDLDKQVYPDIFCNVKKIQMQKVSVNTPVNLFLNNGVSAMFARTFDELHTLKMYGINEDELDILRLGDLGFDFPEEGLYCVPGLYKKDSMLVKKFVEVSLQGWKYVFEHQDEAVQELCTYLQTKRYPVNKTHLRWMFTSLRELTMFGISDRFGLLRNEDVARTVKQMQLANVIPSGFQFNPNTGKGN